MKSDATIRSRYFEILLLLTTVLSISAAHELTVVRTSTNSVDIQLSQGEEVTGIQFRVHTSAGIVLQSVVPGAQLVKLSWIADSYIVNDSTVNVLFLKVNNESLPNGSGTLASIQFTKQGMHEMNSVELTDVMVIDRNGDSLGVKTNNVYWNDNDPFGANTGEQKLFVLGQNYPNPFNPTTMLTYRLNTNAQVRLSIYDITGREVARLIDQYQQTGEYHVTWDSNAGNGQKLASGMYVARLNVGENSVSRKMLLTK